MKVIKKLLFRLKKKYILYADVIILKTLLTKFYESCFKFNEIEGLTVVVTSSGRVEYLKKTMETLRDNLTYDKPIYWYIIDDFGIGSSTKEYILSEEFNLRIFNSKNKGLGYSLNKIYAQVKTKYIFHCEDDWEFLKQIPLHKMIEFLNTNHHIGQVILNRVQPYKQTPVMLDNDLALYDKTFSFNPHLTTKKINLKCLPYPLKETERKITDKLRKLNIKSLIIGFGSVDYVNHIGEDKHVTKY